MKENIFIEFDCPYCNKAHQLGYTEWVKWDNIQHYYCNNCQKHFYFVIDFDYKIKYLEEKDLCDYPKNK